MAIVMGGCALTLTPTADTVPSALLSIKRSRTIQPDQQMLTITRVCPDAGMRLIGLVLILFAHAGQTTREILPWAPRISAGS